VEAVEARRRELGLRPDAKEAECLAKETPGEEDVELAAEERAREAGGGGARARGGGGGDGGGGLDVGRRAAKDHQWYVARSTSSRQLRMDYKTIA
jgi:hypothetical protein